MQGPWLAYFHETMATAPWLWWLIGLLVVVGLLAAILKALGLFPD